MDYVLEDRGYVSPCWIWQLGITVGGYGKLKIDRKTVLSHRYYFEHYRGEIPETVAGSRGELDHLCRTRSCVNPNHIEIVAQPENVRRGVLAKLTSNQVSSVPGLYHSGLSQAEIGTVLGVSQSAIYKILHGHNWQGISIAIACRRDRNLKLSPEQVDEIRRRLQTGETQRSVAKAFGMGQSQISRIARGEAWQTAMVA